MNAVTATTRRKYREHQFYEQAPAPAVALHLQIAWRRLCNRDDHGRWSSYAVALMCVTIPDAL